MIESDTELGASDVNTLQHERIRSDAAAGRIGGHSVSQVVEAPRSQETINGLEAFFRERKDDEVLNIGCGDDRDPAEAENMAWLRYYGGIAGMARVTLVTLLLQYGENSIRPFEGKFINFAKEFSNRIESASEGKLVAGMHSAEGNEGGLAYNPHSENGLGCAYAALIGTVTSLNADEGVVQLGVVEQGNIFGTTDHLATPQRIADANANVGKAMFGDHYETFGLTRADYAALDVPVTTLRGKHAPAANTNVVINFTPNKISDPVKAATDGRPFYDNDVTQVAEAILTAYPELDLDPEILLRVMEHDIRATRAALVHHETHEADASRLEVLTLGSANEAIQYLNAIKKL